MSFGRSLMNAATLGAWGWLTDPDIEEFFFAVPGQVNFQATGDGIAVVESFMKKYGLKVHGSKEGGYAHFKSMKDVHKAMNEVIDHYQTVYRRRDLSMGIDSPEYVLMTSRGGGEYNFTREAVTTHCKSCGRLLAYGKRTKATHVKCKSHPRAGKFLCNPKRADSHEWYHVHANYYGLDRCEINERDPDDYEGDDDD